MGYPVDNSNTYKQQINAINGIKNTANYSSIQAALDEAKSEGGGSVFVASGNHAIASTLKVASGVRLFGDALSYSGGQGTRLTLDIGVNGNVIENDDQVGGDEYIEIAYLYINGREASNTGTCNGVSFVNAEKSYIHNIKLNNVEDAGVYIQDSQECKIAYIDAMNVNDGIYLSNSQDNHIFGCQLTTSGAGSGIKLESASNNNIITNNFSYLCGQMDILITGSDLSNSLYDNSSGGVRAGIYMSGTSADNNVSNNTVFYE